MQPITQADLDPQCDDIRYLQAEQSMDEESNTAISQCTTFLDTRVLCQIKTKITRFSPSDFDFRKRPIGNSGAFFVRQSGHCPAGERSQSGPVGSPTPQQNEPADVVALRTKTADHRHALQQGQHCNHSMVPSTRQQSVSDVFHRQHFLWPPPKRMIFD